jgi:hypothetical protein
MKKILSAIVSLALAACGKPAEPNRTHNSDAVAAAPTSVPAHGSHDPQHGGFVLMDRDLHFEVVMDVAGGAHQIYFSDEMRRPKPPTVVSGVTLTFKQSGETVEAKPEGDHWVAAGKPIADPKTEVARLTYVRQGGEKYFIDLPVAEITQPATGPHGGQVKTTEAGTLELAATAEGAYTLYLLDAAGKPLPATGARLKVALPDYPEVVLAAAGDHLAGQGPPITQAHPAVVAIVDAGGKTVTARFTLHTESHANAP